MEDAVNSCSVEGDSQEESKFAGVVFHNVQEIYIPGKDIRCCFSIKPSVSTTANDWIGLYKVGWQSPKDYLCYEYSPVIENGSELAFSSSLTASLSTQNSVVFRGSKLPSEECEFYQFCYVRSSGEIRGASYPFQVNFSKPGELECFEQEDESGDTLLIVKNRTTILEDSLAKAYDDNAILKESKEKVDADCFKYQDMILNLESKKNDLVSQVEKQKRFLEEAISEKTNFEELWKECDEQLKTSKNALKIANEKVEEARLQQENEQRRHDQTSSDQEKFEMERAQLLQNISHKDGIIQNFLDTMEENSTKTAALEKEIQKLKGENKAVQNDYDNLGVEIAKTVESLKKSEQARAVLDRSLAEQFEQVGQLQAENLTMKEELAATHKEMEDLSHSFGDKQSTMEQKHVTEIAHFEKQIEMFSSQLDGCQQELNVSKEQLDESFSALGKEQTAYRQQIQEYEDSILKLQEQVNQERAFNNSLSSASDRQVAELQEQLNAQLEKNSSALKQTEEQAQEIRRLEENIKLKEKQIKEMQHEMEEQAHLLESIEKRENESLQSTASDNGKSDKNAVLEGSYFALQTAHGQLRKQYLQAKKDMENLWRQKADLRRQLGTVQSELPDSDLRFQMANLKKQIEDLRIRLNMGAEAYKAKFKECRKYENQLKKMRKDSGSSSGQSTQQSPSSVAEFEIRNLKQSLENEKTTAATLRKSLENYKMEAHDAKDELLKITKEHDLLQREVAKLEKEACISNEETQKRLNEDKELQSHIECLHTELAAKSKALKDIEESSKTAAEENTSVIAKLSDENQKLQSAVEEANKKIEEVVAQRDELQEQMERQTRTIEELREMTELVDSVAQHENANTNQGVLSGFTVIEDTCRGVPHPVSTEATPTQNVSLPSYQDGHQCPVCLMFFPPNCAQTEFEKHVNSHFND